MELETIFLHGITQTQKDKYYYVFSHVWLLALTLKLCVFGLEYPLKSENHYMAVERALRGYL